MVFSSSPQPDLSPARPLVHVRPAQWTAQRPPARPKSLARVQPDSHFANHRVTFRAALSLYSWLRQTGTSYPAAPVVTVVAAAAAALKVRFLPSLCVHPSPDQPLSRVVLVVAAAASFACCILGGRDGTLASSGTNAADSLAGQCSTDSADQKYSASR